MTTFADPSTFPSVFDAPTGENADTAPAEAVDAPTGAAQVDEADATTEAEADVDFAGLGLPRPLVRALDRQGITTPFPIQRATVPDALAGRDVLGRGQTGSGKTLAFGLPVIARVADGGRARPLHPKALVLVPTRELAMQVNDALMPLGKAVGVFLKTAVGGVPYDRQIDALNRGVEIVVATPGRLADLIARGVCRLDDVEVTVLDEADQMADMGFLPEVTELLAKTPADAQRLLFSATLDGDVDTLVKRFMTDPVTHSTAPPTAAVSTMDHHLLLIPPHDKFAVAASIAARDGRTMLFARTQLGVDRLVQQLAAVGVRAGGLHGGKTQRMRTRTLAEFREGRMNVLVATDVAARGIHVDGVSLVLHVDPPKDPKDYLHRAGRTARAGESGAVATLVLPKQRRTTLAMLEKAGVEPAQTQVRAGDPALAELTGAREPSGVPVRDEPPAPRRSGDRPSGPRRFERDGRGERRYADRDGRGEARHGSRDERHPGDRDERRFADRERRFGDRPRGEGRYADRDARGEGRFGDRPQGERRFGDRPQGEGRFGDRPQGEGRFGDRPQGERRFTERGERGGDPRTGDRRGGFRPEGRGRDDRPREDRRGFGGRPPARTH
ncbi:DEAD/DEAH box helicase [Micromonospora olivasterospora]|uniref:Superfamily II DNA/RNA helicase n=1 Tax=Micromonospora olivasterospora TaxID=1880 RepID=A0A562IAC4_MICOL|nr:DEAD/DEAH box helicase [Micromonospora olivasterospora]TWH67842.1 superfamily II DNA/RNA helicase [Micromonospora olivasterospora]